MSDYYKNENEFDAENFDGDSNSSVENETNAAEAEQAESAKQPTESSYEWNSGSSSQTSESVNQNEYHYSYINGNNQNASHNPNKYDNAYSSGTVASGDVNSGQGKDSYNPYASQSVGYTHSQNYQSNAGYNQHNTYNYQSTAQGKAGKPKKQKVKKPKKPASRGFVAAILVISIITSAALGFGGGYFANKLSTSSNGGININKVDAGSASATAASSQSTTSEIVKKTADSVVEIATEGITTGSFAQQYVVQGAGSGVIISEDGYIITNYHVIDGASNVTVTLRDGQTAYTAAVIGSDKENDIALLKVDATGLSPATFGDSSTLAVGDYVVAIGNPLGELGGTVTDGIISALAREVTIEGENMTLLQTNAQISPGNSGGGLFNASGELVGIVNAKDSATEVEGIGFAIPINNVLDIIKDLKSYGYVTGKVDLGMQLADITSNESAFYYGVNQTGCYVLSVTKGSNAEKAGFKTGDLITKVNSEEVSNSNDVEKVLNDFNVGDEVEFTVYRSGKSVKLNLVLEEYVPSQNTAGQQTTTPVNDGSDDIWSQMFGW